MNAPIVSAAAAPAAIVCISRGAIGKVVEKGYAFTETTSTRLPDWVFSDGI
ncbi:hypothetical protein [Pseudaminobacter salicylatoxidans]|uniref:hypothetical protein n=1 Tax=Pseudaminobacter salicylatoxidans TaxID=93369 RepID=UPI0002E67911|nr:hypothetical protein [Pseudaminobacter salicylatoxidans]